MKNSSNKRLLRDNKYKTKLSTFDDKNKDKVDEVKNILVLTSHSEQANPKLQKLVKDESYSNYKNRED